EIGRLNFEESIPDGGLAELGSGAASHFRDSTYTDAHGRAQPGHLSVSLMDAVQIMDASVKVASRLGIDEKDTVDFIDSVGPLRPSPRVGELIHIGGARRWKSLVKSDG